MILRAGASTDVQLNMRSAHELETAGLGVHSVALPGAEARPASDALVRRRKAAHAAPLARSAVLRRSHGRIRVHHLRLLRWSAIYARHAQISTLFIPVKSLGRLRSSSMHATERYTQDAPILCRQKAGRASPSMCPYDNDTLQKWFTNVHFLSPWCECLPVFQSWEMVHLRLQPFPGGLQR